jgi:hypothetical protein
MSDRDDDRRVTPDEIDPDAPASAEELAASQRLRDALEGKSSGPGVDHTAEIELALSLRAAWDPDAISSDENRAVVDATPSAEEQEIASRLREALEEKRDPRAGDPATVHLARALRCAFAPPSIDEAEHRAIVDAALEKMAPGKKDKGADVVDLAARRRSTVVRVAFGMVTGGLALAASIVFVVTSAPMHGSEAPLAKARTTQPLFSEPFKSGETSARIDRIASARASDFRDNRFTKWGVR